MVKEKMESADFQVLHSHIAALEELLHREKLNMLGIVAGNVGNELRNPLGVMSNAVFFLDSQLTDADASVKEYLEIIRKEIAGSQRVLSDFIDFFSTRTPRVKEVLVDELIHQSLAGCAVPENVTLSVELPETLPVVKVDPSQMRRIFQNLITNALQAMPERGALRISARWVDSIGRTQGGDAVSDNQKGLPLQKHTDFVEINVADSGAGIPPENMKKVFLPLFTTKSRGIGLGLSICRNLTEANGGRIEVKSELGNGTTFSVILPIRRDKA